MSDEGPPAPVKVVIAGGSGALGRRLGADLLARGHEVIALTRSPRPDAPIREVAWDGRTVGSWADELASDRPVCVVNLAGALVDRRPTRRNIDVLRTSRVEPTLALVRASQAAPKPISRWVQGSTTAIWSDGGDARITESTPIPEPGLPQMTGVAAPWEAASAEARADHRVVLRTSFVFDADTPIMDRLLLLARAGLGGRIGSGRQWVSWIHIDDWLAVARACLGLGDVEVPDGVVIAATDRPEPNAEMMRALRQVAHRSFGLSAPDPLVTAGAWAMGSDPAVALTGRHCTSEVLADLGWTYEHPDLAQALEDLTTRAEKEYA